MIFVNSRVVVEPSQPVRECGTVASHAGTVPSHATLFTVDELDAVFVVSSTKHRNLFTPSVTNLGSASWIIVMYWPGIRPVPVGTEPPTGKMFSCVVSIRQLFHTSGLQPPGPVCEPAETSPGSAMYWPQNEASPAMAGAAWLVGNCNSTPFGTPPGGMLRPAAIW
jgi:hypothetical protein